MANNRIQFKRTSTSGLLPNTTNSANLSYIAAGEFAVNLTDKRVIASDGSATFEVGANLTNQAVTGNVNLTVNGTKINFTANSTAAGNLSSFTLQTDNNFVFYNTATDGSQRAIWANFTNSNTSAFQVLVPLKVATALQDASGANGSSGQVLTSNGTAVNWTTPAAGSGVNTAAQFTWTNTHTFSANVSFSDQVGVANTKAIYFNSLTDANWRVGRNIATYTKAYYTNNSLDFLIGSSSREGITFGNIANTSFLEMGSDGNWFRANVAIGNVAWNSMLTVNGTVTFANSTANTLNVYANGQVLVREVSATNASITTISGTTATFSTVAATNNGSGTNFKVGDDAWIGDVNTADTMSIRGQQNANSGYIVFGNNDTTATLGRAGAGPLTYNGAFTAVGNVTVSTINATSYGATLTSNTTQAVLTIGNSSVQTTINGTAFSGTANNSTNFGGSSLATVQGQITGNAATAYSNAVNYVSAAVANGTVIAASANNATNLNGQPASFYTNATNITTGTLPIAQIPAAVVNTSGAFTISGVHNLTANLVLTGNTTSVLMIGNNNTSNITANATTLVAQGTAVVGQFLANSTTVSVGNATAFTTINATSFSGTANNSTNFGGSSLATIQGQITGNAATAYTNAIAIAANASNITSGTLALARGGTNSSLSATNGGVVYSNATGLAITAAGTNTFVLASNGTAPVFTQIDMSYLPESTFKKSCRAATTADLSAASATAQVLTGGLVAFPAQDGITLAVNDRLLVKDQSNTAQNGIFFVSNTGSAGVFAWTLTRVADANTTSKIASALVAIDEGTVNGGRLFDNDFKTTDTLGTTAMLWHPNFDTGGGTVTGTSTFNANVTIVGNTTATLQLGTGAANGTANTSTLTYTVNATASATVNSTTFNVSNGSTRVFMDITGVDVGNGAANSILSPTALTVTVNSTASAFVNSTTHAVSNGTILSIFDVNGVDVGNTAANSTLTATALALTVNSTANSVVNSTVHTTSNGTAYTNLAVTGISTSAGTILVGNTATNVSINTTTVSIGTTTVNSTVYSGTANNASFLLGSTWVSPGTIGSTTPNSGTFTTAIANTISLGQSNLTGKLYSIKTTSQGINNTTYEIGRISRDTVNWSTQFIEITVYNTYYRGGKTRWIINYSQVDGGTIYCQEAAGTLQHKVYLGPEVLVSGTIYYIPIVVDLPQYTEATIDVRYRYTEVGSITGSGQIQFTNTYTTNASATGYWGGNIHLAPASGNVGIGTTSPAAKLDVTGDIRGSNLTTTTNTATIGTASYFVANGNFGVGTASPGTKLHVGSDYIISGTATATSGAKLLGGFYSGVEHLTTFGSEYSSGGAVLGYGAWPSTSAAGSFVSSTAVALTRAAYTVTSDHTWYGGGTQTVAVGGALTTSERMRLTNAGNLGIGTSSPNARLSLGALVSNKVFSLYDDGTNQYGMGIASNQYRLFGADGASVLFGQYNRGTDTFTERVRIDANGNTGIGNTAPVDKLSVAGTTFLGGNVALSNNYIVAPALKAYSEFVSNVTVSTATTTLDLSTSNFFNLTMSSSTTFTFSNAPAGRVVSFVIVAAQDATGGRTITWPSGTRFAGGVSPPQTTTANAIDIWNILTYNGGSTWIASLAVKGAA